MSVTQRGEKRANEERKSAVIEVMQRKLDPNLIGTVVGPFYVALILVNPEFSFVVHFKNIHSQAFVNSKGNANPK